MSRDPISDLLEAMHTYIDSGGDPETLIDTARMVADERQDDNDDEGTTDA